MADDDATARRLLDALEQLTQAAPGMPTPPQIALPTLRDLEPEMVIQPREAFFGPVDDVPLAEAAGRIAAEQITPYPPGIPAILPGERINGAVLEYLRTGLDAGMNAPDASAPTLGKIRVSVESGMNFG